MVADVRRCDGRGMIDNLDAVRTLRVDVVILLGFRLGAGKVVMVSGDW